MLKESIGLPITLHTLRIPASAFPDCSIPGADVGKDIGGVGEFGCGHGEGGIGCFGVPSIGEFLFLTEVGYGSALRIGGFGDILLVVDILVGVSFL
jgi:hypothetical protein